MKKLYQIEAKLKTGAGDGVRVGLNKLLNDSSEEAKLLAFQLEYLNDHLVTVR